MTWVEGQDARRVAAGEAIEVAAKCLGLLGITRQSRWLGGAASVRSVIGSGTLVRISIPIARHTGSRAGYAAAAGDAAQTGRNGEGKS